MLRISEVEIRGAPGRLHIRRSRAGRRPMWSNSTSLWQTRRLSAWFGNPADLRRSCLAIPVCCSRRWGIWLTTPSSSRLRGGSVTVRTFAASRRIGVEVSDTGPGIPRDEREAVLRRFYRVEQSRNAPGSGPWPGAGCRRRTPARHGSRHRRCEPRLPHHARASLLPTSRRKSFGALVDNRVGPPAMLAPGTGREVVASARDLPPAGYTPGRWTGAATI